MTPAELKNFVVLWVETSLPGTLIIPRNSNGVRPTPPFLDYIVTTKTQIGQVQKSGASITGDEVNKQQKTAVVQIRGYGEETEDLLNTLQMKMSLESTLSLFDQYCVGQRGVTLGVTDITTLLDETQESRFLFESIFGYAEEITENVSYIGTIENIVDQSTINPPM